MVISQPDATGHFGPYGGRFVPEVLMAPLEELEHAYHKAVADPALWRAIQSHVVHIHVKDSVAGTASGAPFEYVLPGTGEFPMAALRSVLAGRYNGLLSLEWEKQWHPELPSIEEALRTAASTSWW